MPRPDNNALHLTIAAANRCAALAGERECSTHSSRGPSVSCIGIPDSAVGNDRGLQQGPDLALPQHRGERDGFKKAGFLAPRSRAGLSLPTWLQVLRRHPRRRVSRVREVSQKHCAQNNALHLTIAAATRWAALAGEREC